MRSICCLLPLLLLPLTALAHEEVIRTDLRAIEAELVAVGRVVQVEATRGSQGPRQVSILLERTLEGEADAAALTFRAPVEHGPGWAVGDRALFFLTRYQGSWHAAALAAESPRGDVAALEAQWRSNPARSAPPALDQADESTEEEAAALSFPGLIAGACCFLGLLGLGWRRRIRKLPAP